MYISRQCTALSCAWWYQNVPLVILDNKFNLGVCEPTVCVCWSARTVCVCAGVRPLCVFLCCSHYPQPNWTWVQDIYHRSPGPILIWVWGLTSLGPRDTIAYGTKCVSAVTPKCKRLEQNDNSSVDSWLGHVQAQHSGAQIMRSHWRDLVGLWDGWSCHPSVNSYHLISRAIKWWDYISMTTRK